MKINKGNVKGIVARELKRVGITDIHTHLYDPCFGDLLLWGVDELLTYHYLVAETFRWVEIPYAEFWKLSKPAQADLVWKTLFIDHAPISEACRGVLTALKRLGLDTRKRNLDAHRRFFAKQKVEKHVDLCFKEAGLKNAVMTNDPFDDQERPGWLNGNPSDERFIGALRIDPVLLAWDRTVPRLRDLGYEVEAELTDRTIAEVQRFLREWAGRTKAVYVGISLPPTFTMPEESVCATLIEKACLPVFRDMNLPFAMMIGVKRRVNPGLTLAGDGVGRGRIESVEYLCSRFPKNKFMLTMLSRENQHEACVAARKFRNLLVFGCWWFVNNPSIIEDMTRMRFELLGPSVIPQHSDARVLDQIIYKWDHSKRIIGKVLVDKYTDLLATGWAIDAKEIRRDIEGLFGGYFWEFLRRSL